NSVTNLTMGPGATLGFAVTPGVVASGRVTATDANIAGGTLEAVLQGYGNGASTTYADVVVSPNPVTGTFDHVTSSSVLFRASATYDANDVNLTLDPVSFASLGLNPVEQSVLSASPDSLLDLLTTQSSATVGMLAESLNALSGQSNA